MEEGLLKTILVIAAIGIYLALLVFVFYATGKAIFHMYKMIKNTTGKYTSFFAGLLLAMPSQFNDEGNFHRLKFIKTLPWLAGS